MTTIQLLRAEPAQKGSQLKGWQHGAYLLGLVGDRANCVGGDVGCIRLQNARQPKVRQLRTGIKGLKCSSPTLSLSISYPSLTPNPRSTDPPLRSPCQNYDVPLKLPYP